MLRSCLPPSSNDITIVLVALSTMSTRGPGSNWIGIPCLIVESDHRGSCSPTPNTPRVDLLSYYDHHERLGLRFACLGLLATMAIPSLSTFLLAGRIPHPTPWILGCSTHTNAKLMSQCPEASPYNAFCRLSSLQAPQIVHPYYCLNLNAAASLRVSTRPDSNRHLEITVHGQSCCL